MNGGWTPPHVCTMLRYRKPRKMLDLANLRNGRFGFVVYLIPPFYLDLAYRCLDSIAGRVYRITFSP
jgi:hypothetical protein